MALKLYDDRSLTVSVRHVEAKPNGSFQYRRRIPVCLHGHYPGKAFYVRSLGRDAHELARKAADLTAELDGLWARLRADSGAVEDIPAEGQATGQDAAGGPQTALQVLVGYLGARKATEASRNADAFGHIAAGPAPFAVTVPLAVITLGDALALYLSHHPKGEMKKFRADAERVVNGVVAMAGDLPLSFYTRQQAQAYRDDLLTRNSTGTVRRRLDTLVAVFNKAVAEEGLTLGNAFENLSIPQEGQDAKKREGYTTAELSVIAGACRRLDDDIRHIIGLQLDTGARAGEIIGLRVQDVVLDHAVPHVRIRPFGTVRTLKTDASRRDIPLVGVALWSAGRAVAAAKARGNGGWLFSRYASDREVKATHASNTLNKWLSGLEGVANGKTTHCMRHAMRDRLRAAQVPHDIQEAIGGWGARTVGQGYGQGYPLEVLHAHMTRMVLRD
ncbi:integrase [Lichenibacterium minor]|uniref:Integrase n=1 Tax=Lichenibacterium minor TaxID=2316528 RepID=A0A4Q2U413_9HYPH|nr:tyrosine-type recombinase/integrase [Lichenibacterium minor]RYC29506.1 integrase [Lichenibacterium minor]